MKLSFLTENQSAEAVLQRLGWELDAEYKLDEQGQIVPGKEHVSSFVIPSHWRRFPGAWGDWPDTRFSIMSDAFSSFEGSPTAMAALYCRDASCASLRGIGRVINEIKLVDVSCTSLAGFQCADDLCLINCKTLTDLTGLEGASISRLTICNCGIETLDKAPAELSVLVLEGLSKLKRVRLPKTKFLGVERANGGSLTPMLQVDNQALICLSPYLILTPGLRNIASNGGLIGRDDILDAFNHWLKHDKSRVNLLRFQQRLIDDPSMAFMADN